MTVDEEILQSIRQTTAARHWEKIGINHHHGILMPVFSLRSLDSMGIGEYSDLMYLVDWCADIGMNVIQILPVNDPGLDSSPYNAISANALNPLNLGLRHLPDFFETEDIHTLTELNKLQRVDYPKVRIYKLKYLKDYFAKVGKRIMESEEYKNFVKDNPWLKGYSVFKILKMGNDWKSWQTWDEEIRTPSDKLLDRIKKEMPEEYNFHIFVQYLCFKQLQDVKKAANQKGILLKGDIPILISPDSEEVWCHRNLFDLDLSAGAPPDIYNIDGQNWGFPLFNWDKLKQQDYRWWKLRLGTASKLYDIYRLDHIMGFFRIWAIPDDSLPIDGYYVPNGHAEWYKTGKERLEMMLSCTGMLPIGEDLGTVPEGVHDVMEEMGIPGMRVLRLKRSDYSLAWSKKFPPLSLSTVSTHDGETVDLWWRNNPEEVDIFCYYKRWKHTPLITQEQRIKLLQESHSSSSLFHINLLSEYLALFPELVWENMEDERINLPGVISDRNWSIRHRPLLEEIASHKSLKEMIKNEILS